MRIALFTETYSPYINGVVTHVKILKEGLERLGHTVLVVTADPTILHHKLVGGILYCPAARVKKLYNYGLAAPLSRTRLHFLEDFAPDVVHVHNEFGVGLSGILIARELKIPIVYTLHTMYDEYVYYVAPRQLAGVATVASHRYTKFFAKNADAITGPSKKCEVYFRKIGIDKEVNVIPNAAELDSFVPPNVDSSNVARVMAELGLPNDKMLCCFVGRLGREKSVDVLLDFWAKNITDADNMHMLIIGDGPCKAELEVQAARLGIADMITFAGAVAHESLPPYIVACNVYITASLSDTNSISMLEAMAAGLPVLQRLDELNANQVREGENGFVFNSPQELGEKLRKIKNMPHDELMQLKSRVTQSVLRSGALDLASCTFEVYEKAIAAFAHKRSRG